MKALEMERPMDSWNDERLDEMSRRMDEGFRELREEMRGSTNASSGSNGDLISALSAFTSC
jgi:hypothetical protein